VNVVREFGQMNICPIICLVCPLRNLYRRIATTVYLLVQWLLRWRVWACRQNVVTRIYLIICRP